MFFSFFCLFTKKNNRKAKNRFFIFSINYYNYTNYKPNCSQFVLIICGDQSGDYDNNFVFMNALQYTIRIPEQLNCEGPCTQLYLRGGSDVSLALVLACP